MTLYAWGPCIVGLLSWTVVNTYFLGAGTGASGCGVRLGELPSAGAINWIPKLAPLESPWVFAPGDSGASSSPSPHQQAQGYSSVTLLQTQQVLLTSSPAVVPTGPNMGGGWRLGCKKRIRNFWQGQGGWLQ